jgi:hypothetical protein
MWTSAYRDVADVRPIQKPMAAFDAGLDAIADELAGALAPRGRAAADVRATLRHALRFSTWQSLAAEGLDDTRAAKLAAAWLDGIA